MKQINWKWPQTRNNNLFPWYVIPENLMALPFMLLGIVFGFDELEDFIVNNFET